MKKNNLIVLFLGMLLALALPVLAGEQLVTEKVRTILPEGWTVTEKSDGIPMYERAAQSLELQDYAKLPGFMLIIIDTRNTVAKDTQHPKDYNPYFEIFFYKLSLTEEQIIKYNRLANAQYNRPAGTQEAYPPRFSFQKGEYIVMKSPTWGKSASPGIDSLMLKVMSLVRKEIPETPVPADTSDAAE
ncbi:MAG: hypothetical protein PHD29_00420 [bacterium]|nr:hypothetical protein [bacterium]MDD5756703.1 hypothetical protein [bacterium]